MCIEIYVCVCVCVCAVIVPRDYWEDVDGVRRLWSPDIFYRMYNPGLSEAEKIVLVLNMISRCKVAKSIPWFLPTEYVIAEDEDEENEGARDDHREVEDVMETDNDDQELSSEEGEGEEEEEGLGEREGARGGGDAWWEEKFDRARYNPEGLLTFCSRGRRLG